MQKLLFLCSVLSGIGALFSIPANFVKLLESPASRPLLSRMVRLLTFDLGSKVSRVLLVISFLLNAVGFYVSWRTAPPATMMEVDIIAMRDSAPLWTAGQPGIFNFRILHKGPLPIAQSVRATWDLHFRSAPEGMKSAIATADELFSELDNKFKSGGDETTVDLASGEGRFSTGKTRSVSAREVQDLADEKLLLYVVGKVRWTDTSGNHIREVCSILTPPQGRVLIWAACYGQHNRTYSE